MKLKAVVDVELQTSLAEKLPHGKWIGHYYLTFCPFHDNTHTPAFFVYPDQYKCLGCGAWGNLQVLEKKLAGVAIRYVEGVIQEVNEHPDWIGWKKRYGSYKNAAIYAYNTAQEYPCLLRYLTEQRNIQIDDGYIGYIDGWLSFPVFNQDGDMVDWVVRSTPSIETTIKYSLRPRINSKEGFILYSNDWDRIEQSHEVYVPYGILDMHSLHNIGLPCATGLTGKTFNVDWFKDIRKKIYLIPDKGEEEDAHKLAHKLGWRARVLTLDFPEDTKDEMDVYSKYGKQSLLELIKEKVT